MKEVSFFILFFFVFLELLFADLLKDGLEKNGEKENFLVLNTVILHDQNENYRSGIHPKNAVEFLGSTGAIRFLYTSYISTNGKDSRLHKQKLELFSPIGKKVFSGEKTFEVESFSMPLGAFQRGYLEQEISFPFLRRSNPSNFGIYRLKIYLDGKLKRIFLIPIFAR